MTEHFAIIILKRFKRNCDEINKNCDCDKICDILREKLITKK